VNDSPEVSLTSRDKEIEKLVREGATRLLSRALDSRKLDSESLSLRVAAGVERYLLRNDPNCSDKEIIEFIDGMQAEDLCLIIACERGDESAWGELVERFTSTVKSAARSASSNEDAAEDLAQSIWAELYGLRNRKDGKPASKLAYYSGRGSLAGWLRAVVGQLAIDTYRKQSRLVQADEDADLDRLANETTVVEHQSLGTRASQNPEQLISDKFVESEMQEALRESVSLLSAEDRLLIKLYYFDNLRLREAGAVLGVHEATASRRLTRIHSDLRKQVVDILVGKKGWTKAETERAFAELGQHIDADLEGILNESVS